MPGYQTVWDSLEQWSSTAFIASAVFLVGDTLFQALTRFTAIAIPGEVRGIFMLSGMVAAILGVLGIYPQLADRTPRLARVSVIVTAIAWGTFAVIWVWWLLSQLLPVVSEPIPAVNMLAVVTMVLGFLLFGVASLRTDVPSRSVGILLLAIVAVFTGMVVVLIGRIELPSWAIVAVLGVLSAVMLTIGYLLRTHSTQADRTTPSSDSIAP